MGLEFVRGNNARCPPFLVGGLSILCLFLLCSWWSLSSQNFELLRQADNLAEQLKINGEELNKCTDQKSSFEVQMKDFQNKYNQERVKYDQAMDAEQDLKLKWEKDEEDLKKKYESELKSCHTEMDSLKKLGESKDKTLETLRTDKKDLVSALEEKKKQIKELDDKINELKNQISEINRKCSSKSIAQMLKDNIDKKNLEKPDTEIQANVEPADQGPIVNANHDLADESLNIGNNEQDSGKDQPGKEDNLKAE